MNARQLHRAINSAVVFFTIACTGSGIVRGADQTSQVVVLLDATSTMAAPCGTMSRFDVARWCLSDILDLTPNGVSFCFVVAGNGGHAIECFEAMSPDVRCDIRRRVMRISPGGASSLASCFADPRMVLPGRPDQKTFVVMITDGQSVPVGSTSAAVTQWQKACGRPVQSVVVGPCTEITLVESLSRFAASCGASFTQCSTAQRLHQPLIEAFQICQSGCESSDPRPLAPCAANHLKLVELQERLSRIERDAATRMQLLSQLNFYVGATSSGNGPLTQAIFGKFAEHVEGNRNGIAANHASLNEVKEGIRRTARFIGYDASAETLRSVNDRIQADTTIIKETLHNNEQLDRATVERLNELQTKIDGITNGLPSSIDDKIKEVTESLSSTKWGALILAGLAVLFSGTTAAGGTWGLNRVFGLVQRQDRAATQVAEGVAGDLSRHATDNSAQFARLMESLSVLNDRLDERVRRTTAEVATAQTAELREKISHEREAVANAIEKSEASLRLLLQTSLDTQRDRLTAAIRDGVTSTQADMQQIHKTIDANGLRSSDLLAKVARRVDKCAASIATAESIGRDRAGALKEQMDLVSSRNQEWNAATAQQLDSLRRALPGAETAHLQRYSSDASRNEELFAPLRNQLSAIEDVLKSNQSGPKAESDLASELSLLRAELAAKMKRIDKRIRRIQKSSSAEAGPLGKPHIAATKVRDVPIDPVSDLLRIDSLSREHANRLYEQGIETLTQLADLDEATIVAISHAIPFLGTVGLHKLRTKARGILANDVS